MAYFKHKEKIVKVTSNLDVKEWEKDGHKQCDENGKALGQSKPEDKK